MTFRYQVLNVFYTGEIVGELEFEYHLNNCMSLTFDFQIKEITSEHRALEPVLEIVPGIFVLSNNLMMEIPSGVQVDQICQIALHCPYVYSTYENAAGALAKEVLSAYQNPKVSGLNSVNLPSEYLKTKINMGLQVTLRGKLCV